VRAAAALLAALAVVVAAVPPPAAGADSAVTRHEKKAPRIPLEPGGYEKVVILLGDGNKEYKYYQFSPRTPLALEVAGPTTLSIMVRLLFDKTMKGTQDFSLRIDERGLLGSRKEVATHALKAHKSTVSTLKGETGLVPGKAETLDLAVPEGTHGYGFTLGGAAAATALIRIQMPKKDLAPAKGAARGE
jgi:hypothetical protein